MPPVSTSTPFAISSSANAFALAIVWRWRARNGSVCAIPSATALAAMMCISGPPCWPGKTERSIVLGELLAAEDHPAARAAEGLVDRGGDDVGVLDRVRVLAGGDEAGEVGHVDHQLRADRVGDLAERGEVELARVGRPAGDDHLRPVLVGEPRDLVHVAAVVLAAHVVGDDLVELARDVQLHPVGEVAAVVERHAHDRVAGLEHRHVGGVVGLGAGVRLDVGVLGAEQLLGAVDRELLGDVDLLAAAVVAAAGVALGVLVGEHRARRRRAPPGGRSSRRRSSPASTAGARARASSTVAISGSTSASGAVWKSSGRSEAIAADNKRVADDVEAIVAAPGGAPLVEVVPRRDGVGAAGGR